MDKSQYALFVGENVVAPSLPAQQHTPEFVQLLLNACIASSAAYEVDATAYLETHGANHSLVFAQTAKDPKPAVSPKHLPWCICATEVDPHFGGRTWFVSFRGTKTLEDILTDATVLPVPSTTIARGSVHMGFQQRAGLFDPLLLLPWLRDDARDKVVIVGHSLGGAAALLTFLNVLKVESINGQRLLEEGRLRCVTFGAPLIGDQYFAADVRNIAGKKSLAQQPVIHIVHKDDLVPKIVSTLTSALLLKNAKVDRSSQMDVNYVKEAVKSLSAMLITNAVPAAAFPLAILNGITAAVKIVASVVLAYARERVMVGAGAFIRLTVSNELPDLCWCGSAGAANLLGPQNYPDSAAIQNAIQSHSISHHYLRHLQSVLQHYERDGFMVQRSRSDRVAAVRNNRNIMSPIVDPTMCSVYRSDRVFEAHIEGSSVIWLRNARAIALMPTANQFAHICPSVQKNVHLVGDSVVQYVNISMELKRSLLEKNGEYSFFVHLYGYFGDAVWDSQVKIRDIKVCWGNMQPDEKMTLEDGRFAFLQPDAMIDAAILRTSLICRAVGLVPATQARLQANLDLTTNELLGMLSRSEDKDLIAWIQRSVSLIKGITMSANPSYFLDNLDLARDLIFPTNEKNHVATASETALALKHTASVVQLLTEFYENKVYTLEEFGNSYALVLDLASSPLLTDELLEEALRLHRSGNIEGANALLNAVENVYKSSGVMGLAKLHRSSLRREYERTMAEYLNAGHQLEKLVDAAFKLSLMSNLATVPPIILPLRALARAPFYTEVDKHIFQIERLAFAALGCVPLFIVGLLSIFGNVVEAVARAVVGINYELQSFLFKILSESKNAVDVRFKLLSNAWTSNGAFRSYHYVRDGLRTAESYLFRRLYQDKLNFHAEILHKNVLDFVLRYVPDVTHSTTTVSGGTPPGNMFTLECFLEERIRNLNIADLCESFDQNSIKRLQQMFRGDLPHGINILLTPVLLLRESFAPSAFVDLLRASSLLHRLRIHMTSTYVVVVCGLRGHGKSSITRFVLGCDSKCGPTLDESTSEAQPFYIPVPGEGIVKHLLIIDLPGSNDEVANPSLSQAEGFAVADLVIFVGKQDRTGTADKVKLLKSTINNAIGIDAAIYNKRNVCSWAPENIEQLSNNSTKMWEDDTRQIGWSNCKVVHLMTHADEQLSSLVAQHSVKMSQLSAGIFKETACNMAKSLATKSWCEIVEEMSKAGLPPALVSDRIAVASCAVVEHNLLNQASATSATMQRESRIILDAQGVRDFLSQFVPPNVGDVIKGRTVPPQLDTSDEFAQYLPA